MARRDRPVKTSSPFAVFLERGTLQRMAGARSFERGEDYFLSRQVKTIAEEEGRSRQRCREPSRIGSSCGLRKETWNTRVLALWGQMASSVSIAWP